MSDTDKFLIDSKEEKVLGEFSALIKKHLPDLPKDCYSDVEVIFDGQNFGGLKLKGKAQEFVVRKKLSD